MKKILVASFLSISTFLGAQSVDAVKTALNSLGSDASMKHASIGFIAIDAATGKTLVSKNPDLSLTPASTMKLVTTATAMELFGPKHRFKTTIEYHGTIDKEKKILSGDIYITGGGDPTLGSTHFKSSYGDFINEWVFAIKQLGIDSINGRIIGDGSYFNDNTIPGSWIWSDIGNYYGSGPWGLSIMDNTYELNLKSGPNDGDPTEVISTEPEMKDIIFDNQIKASNVNRDNGYIYGAPYSNHRILGGTIPKNRSKFTIKGSIPNPPLFAAQLLNEKLIASGLKVSKAPTCIYDMKSDDAVTKISKTTIFTTNSPMLKDIIKRTNMKSVNLYAEHLLIHAGLKLGSNDDTESASEFIDNFWRNKGINVGGMFINDGSGLSRKDAVTVRQLAKIALYMNKKSAYKTEFCASLPVAGKSGTLSSMCRSGSGNGRVHAKSGSMSRVKSYAGYIDTQSGKTIGFAVILNNYTGSNSAARRKIETILNAIAAM